MDDKLLLAGTFSLMVLFGVIYFVNKEKRGKWILVFKAMATSMTVLLSGYFTIRSNGNTGWWIFCGAVLCMAADVLLELWLLAGVFCFGLAHISFICGFIKIQAPTAVTGIIFVFLYSIMVLMFYRYLPILRSRKLLLPGLLYAALLCIMAAVAVSGIISLVTVSRILQAAGGICFLISDCILGISYLEEKKESRYGAFVLILYYLAVYLLALSLQ